MRAFGTVEWEREETRQKIWLFAKEFGGPKGSRGIGGPRDKRNRTETDRLKHGTNFAVNRDGIPTGMADPCGKHSKPFKREPGGIPLESA